MAIDLSTIPHSTFIDIVHEFLSAGVPPTTLAIAFSLDPDDIKLIRDQLNIRNYGTSEIYEAMNHLQWKAYETALQMLRTGTPSERRQTINMVLARTVGIAGKQPSGEFDKIREQLVELAAQSKVEPDSEISEFVVN